MKKRNPKPGSVAGDASAQRPEDTPQAPLVPVVCVGASAGGLEALEDIFKQMPPDSGVALVVITHQHPGHTSLLPAFRHTFHTRTAEIEGRPLTDIGQREWDIPALQEMLQTILPQQAAVTGFKVERDFPGLGHKTFLLNARCLEQKSGLPPMILLAMEETK